MSISEVKIRVKALSLALDGRGIAQDGDLELHIADLLPGEVADVVLDDHSQHHRRAWGHIAQRIGETSPERRVPACPAFGECGGCAWQMLSYQAQLQEKRRRVHRALVQALPSPPAVPAPLAAPQTLGYRNKGKYVFGLNQGEIVIGAYRPRTHEVVSTIGCKIVEAAIDEVATELLAQAKKLALPVYQEKNPGPGMRYAILRSNRDGDVLLTLVCSSETERSQVLKLGLALLEHPRVVGVLRCDNDLRSGGLLTEQVTLLGGDATLEEQVLGVPVPLGCGFFWQIHRTQAEHAYRAIAEALPVVLDSLVLELYSGAGGIAFALAESGHQVLGIDRSEDAVQAANAAARAHGLASKLRFRCQDATRLAPEDFANASAVVVDPPRKGLGDRGVQQLGAAMPAHIAYLSCGPESLARDLAQLVSGGYRIESLQLFDFMPGTAQVECLAVLQRAQ